jgi:LacI family transcriptional regulator
MDARIAVASVSLGSGFPGLMFASVRKQLRPGQTIVECATVRPAETEFARTRLLGLLEGTPRPIAFIGICIRPDDETLAAYRAARMPVVLIDEEAPEASTVASDNLAGGYLAGQHLVAKGRRSIAVVSGRARVEGGYNAAQRVKGLEKALDEAGLSLARECLVEVVDYSRKDGVAAMEALLTSGRRIDAVFCAAGDACATGVLAAARERRVRIPEDVAVVGYDDNPLAGIADPPLTTVRQPIELIAREAHRLATEETAAIFARPKRVLFEPRLVTRSST